MYDDTCVPAVEHSNNIMGIPSLVQAIANIIQEELEFEQIQFLSCTCDVDMYERKNLKQKNTHDSMEPVKKKWKLQQLKKQNKNVFQGGSFKKETPTKPTCLKLQSNGCMEKATMAKKQGRKIQFSEFKC